MEQGSDPDDEIDNLQKEQDMPIEELLAMYGGKTTDPDAAVAAEAEKNGQTTAAADVDGADEQGGAEDITAVASGGDDVEMLEEPEVISSRSSTSEETTNNNEKESKPDAKPERKAKQKKISELAQLYTDMDTNGNDATTGASSRSLRSTAGSRQQSEDEDEEEGECSGEEEDWHKTIMIGSSYQAQVPEGLSAYGATPPYENQDTLLWEPGKLRAKQTEDYLRALNHPPPGTQGVAALPLGRHVRDDEQALYLLLQCGYNVEEALRRHRMNPSPLASTMTLWSEEECRNFENGLKTYGKDFHLIQQNKVRTRSVGELVQFYYLWKKTERHDLFAAKSRIEKKKYIVHPGTTDYMDRFLDEGQHQHHQAQADAVLLYRGENTRAPSPAINSLLYGRRSPGTAAVGVAAPISIPSVAASAAIASAVPAATGEPTAHPLLLAADTSTDASVSGGLNQLEDLARHLDSDHLNHLAASLASAGAPMEIDTAAAVMAARAAAAVVATSGRQLITGPSTATAPSVPASPITTATPPTSLAH